MTASRTAVTIGALAIMALARIVVWKTSTWTIDWSMWMSIRMPTWLPIVAWSLPPIVIVLAWLRRPRPRSPVLWGGLVVLLVIAAYGAYMDSGRLIPWTPTDIRLLPRPIGITGDATTGASAQFPVAGSSLTVF